MNKVILMGRLTKDPESKSTSEMIITKYSLAVDRRGKDKEADFINIVAFGKAGEFAEKYFHKGMKVLVTGHIQTGSYTNKDGQKVYTTDVIAEDQEFCESKSGDSSAVKQSNDEFVSTDGKQWELPF